MATLYDGTQFWLLQNPVRGRNHRMIELKHTAMLSGTELLKDQSFAQNVAA